MTDDEFDAADVSWTSAGSGDTVFLGAAIYEEKPRRSWRWLWLRKRHRVIWLPGEEIPTQP